MKLQRSAPEKQGVKSLAIVNFLDKIKGENHEMHSFMLLKNGCVISECWWEPYAPQYRHQLFSLSKSFASTAIGLAVNDGLLTVDTLVADIFNKEIEELGNNIDEKIKKMTVKNLLTMGTGMEYENWNGENNIKSFLSSHIKNEPGSVFFYHTLATYMQSAVITRLTGQKLVDYLKPRLFDPLDIDPIWEEDNLGVSFGGFGLNIKTEDIAKFGQLYLQKGVWNGRQLIPESWVVEATSKQIENAGNDLNTNGDWNQGYGYQFWRCKPDGVYRGDGAYGQFCIVIPDANAVVAITSNADMGKTMQMVWDILLPALRENNEPTDTAEDKPAHKKLLQAQKNLSHLKVNVNAPDFPEIRGLYKPAPQAKLNNYDVYIDITASDGIFKAIDRNNKKDYVYRFKKGEWVENASLNVYGTSQILRNKSYGEWRPEENTLDLILWFYEAAAKSPIKLKFNKNKTKLTLAVEGNYNFELELVKGSDICAPR
jgi:CubicO group peptidase (beta-lactamase class C family)